MTIHDANFRFTLRLDQLDAFNRYCCRDCTNGKTYTGTHHTNAFGERVTFVDDVGDEVTLVYDQVKKMV